LVVALRGAVSSANSITTFATGVPFLITLPVTPYSPAERVPVAVGEVVGVAVFEGVNVAEGGVPVDVGVPSGPDVAVRVGDGVVPGGVVSDGVGDSGGVPVFGVTNAANGV